MQLKTVIFTKFFTKIFIEFFFCQFLLFSVIFKHNDDAQSSYPKRPHNPQVHLMISQHLELKKPSSQMILKNIWTLNRIYGPKFVHNNTNKFRPSKIEFLNNFLGITASSIIYLYIEYLKVKSGKMNELERFMPNVIS